MDLTKNIRNLDSFGFARGGFAVVHKASFCSKDFPNIHSVAIKFPDVRNIGGAGCVAVRMKMLQRWKREITVGQSVSHPNILPFLGFCDNLHEEYRDFVGLVLPFCANGDSKSYTCGLSAQDKMYILCGVAAAISALQSFIPPVVHGDIKASNILIGDNGQPLLADFGLSRVCETEGFTTQSIMGSCRWMAAELLCASADDQTVRTTLASDVWAFSMTILEILTGKPPFSELKTDGAVFLSIVVRQAIPERPNKTLVSDALWMLLKHCWNKNAALRPNAQHVGLILDIVYGLGLRGLQLSSTDVSEILGFITDDLSSPCRFPKSCTEYSKAPYKCKWLHCSLAFDNIDDCIAHECEGFIRRSTGHSC